MSDINLDTTPNVEMPEQEAAVAVQETEQVESKPLTLDEAYSKAVETLTADEPEKPAKFDPAAATAGIEKASPMENDPSTGLPFEPIKPPPLTPVLREKWNKLDRDVQAYIADRERQHSKTIQETADVRKSWDEFHKVTAPYEALLRQHGKTATAHAQDLFNLSHTLTVGTPQHKAQIIANLILSTQPDAEALRASLAGQPPQQQPQQMQQPVNVRSEVEQMLKERHLQQQELSAQQEMASFMGNPANEFANDVRDLMSRAIDAEFVGGNSYAELYKNAYEFACKNHPEVAQVIAQRTSKPTATAKPAVKPNGTVKPSMGANRAAPIAGTAKFKTIEEAMAAAQAALAG